MAKYSGRTLTVDFEGSPLGELREFSEFGSTRALIDASVYGEDWTDFVTGLQDGTEVTGILLDPSDTGAAALIASYEGGSDTPVTLTATHVGSGDAWDITAKLTKVAYMSPLDGLLQLNFTAKIVNPGVVAS